MAQSITLRDIEYYYNNSPLRDQVIVEIHFDTNGKFVAAYRGDIGQLQKRKAKLIPNGFVYYITLDRFEKYKNLSDNPILLNILKDPTGKVNLQFYDPSLDLPVKNNI